jgi:hypothetical protein
LCWEVFVLDALLQGWNRTRAADGQAGDRHATSGEDRFEVALGRLTLEHDRVGMVGVTDVLDARSPY